MTEVLNFNIHQEENELPLNSKIQGTDPLVSLQFGTRHFTCANRQRVYAPFGCLLYFGDSRNV